MIDLTILRKDASAIKPLLAKKDPSFDIDALVQADKKAREVAVQVETLRSKKNELAAQAKQGITQGLREESILVGKQLKELEESFEQVQKDFEALYLACPNIPDDSVPAGGKEANQVVKTVGQKPEFTFAPKHHLELGNSLGWFDFEAAAKMAKSNFALYKGDAVKLMYSLTMLMLKNNMKHGFMPILPPYVINTESLTVAGQLPKFKDGVFKLEDESLYLSPTSEVNLTSIYRDTILQEHELPVRMTAWSSCFRREAGTYGHAERGLIRIHEFEKVELFSITKPQDSYDELDRMVACAEEILKALGLHYRISLLAAGDASFQSAKTFDLEVWMPGQNAYYEVSSASNCTDFQSRRGKIRFKDSMTGKTVYAHTLNASSLALPRLMVAIMETYQQPDGTIALPDIIKQQGLF
jgi:seryl-tRNA synthetase